MNIWRKEALDRIPEYKEFIESAQSLDILWGELWLRFAHTYEDPSHKIFAPRVYDYASWCLAESRGVEIKTATALALHLHLPANEAIRRDVANHLTTEAFDSLRVTLKRHLPESEYQKFERGFPQQSRSSFNALTKNNLTAGLGIFLTFVFFQFLGALLIVWTNWLYEGYIIVRPGFSERQLPAVFGFFTCFLTGLCGGAAAAVEGRNRWWWLVWSLWGLSLAVFAYGLFDWGNKGMIPEWLASGAAYGLGLSGVIAAAVGFVGFLVFNSSGQRTATRKRGAR